jgi:hypothetical protein
MLDAAVGRYMRPAESVGSIAPEQIGHLALTVGGAVVDGSSRLDAVPVARRRSVLAYSAGGRPRLRGCRMTHTTPAR